MDTSVDMDAVAAVDRGEGGSLPFFFIPPAAGVVLDSLLRVPVLLFCNLQPTKTTKRIKPPQLNIFRMCLSRTAPPGVGGRMRGLMWGGRVCVISTIGVVDGRDAPTPARPTANGLVHTPADMLPASRPPCFPRAPRPLPAARPPVARWPSASLNGQELTPTKLPLGVQEMNGCVPRNQ